jgi:hypothetical protein
VKKFPILIILAVLVGGCNSYRFVPSHGGGKRFDEEERAVAAAIRNAVAQVEVDKLSGHKTNVVITTLGHNGGATLNFPGFNNAAASYSYNSQNYSTVPVVLSNQDSWSASLNYNPNTNAVPTVFGTDQDVAYLEAALHLKLRVNDVSVAVPDPEYILYVLVDVLGTNRSKQDSFVVWQDTLTASCELTYYILDPKTNKIVSEAKRAAAEASYREASIFGFAGYEGQRLQYRTTPNPMPTDVNDPVILFNKTVVFQTGKSARYETLQKGACGSSKLPQPNTDPNSASAPSPAPLAASNAAPPSAAAPNPAPAPDPNIASASVLATAPSPPPVSDPNGIPRPAPVSASAATPNPAPAPDPNVTSASAPAPAPEPNSNPKLTPVSVPTPAPSPLLVSEPNVAPSPVLAQSPAPVPEPNSIPKPAPVSAPALEPNTPPAAPKV